jgi:hypothetical protein
MSSLQDVHGWDNNFHPQVFRGGRFTRADGKNYLT